jgi:hypothetical protein
MNKRIKELAERAGLITRQDIDENNQEYFDDLECFAELVRQDERGERGAVLRKQDEQIKEMQLIHTNLREKFNKAVLEEREACLNCYSPDDTAQDWIDKIKARGEK